MTCYKKQQDDPIDCLIKEAKSKKSKSLTVGDIYNVAVENDGYAILIASLAIVIILPVGALPGVPAVAGVVMCALYMSIIIQSFSPNLPKSISKIKVKSSVVMKVCDLMNKGLSRLDGFAKENRLQLFNSQLSLRFVAILGVIFSIATIIIGFIPFVPTLLMLPILLFSFGGILKDGLFTVLGYVCSFGFLMIAIGAVV